MQTSRRALLLQLAFSFVLISQCAVAQTVIATATTGFNPVALAINLTTNKIYVVNGRGNDPTCASNGTVTVIDGVTNGTTAVVNVGKYPAALAVNSTTNKIYVLNRGDNTVSVIDGATYANTATVATGHTPGAVAVNPVTNRIYIINENSNNVTVIDGASNSIIANLGVGVHPYAVGVNSVTNKIYIANSGNGTVTVVDGQTNSVAATVSVGSFPYAVAVNSLTNKIYVANYGYGTVSVIDGKSNTTTATVGVGSRPVSVAVDPVTNTIYASNFLDGTVSAIDGTRNVTTATVVVGRSPDAVAVDPATNTIYASNFLDGTVNAFDGVDRSVATVKVGSNPDAVALNPVTNRVYVANSGDGTVSIIGGANSEPFSGPLQFIPITPCRVADTRNPNGGSGPIQGGNFQTFNLPQLAQSGGCADLSSAAVYSLNVTVVPQGPLGYLTIWPTGEDQPSVSTLNSFDGRVKANAAIVPAGYQGAVSVFVTNTTNVVLDIDGYFAPVSNSTLAFYPLAPCRVADTRNKNGDLGGPYLTGGKERDFPMLEATACNIPNTAQAYSLNFTVVPHQPLGYLTTWAAGKPQPPVSILNSLTGTVVANAAIVPAGANGAIAVFAANPTDLVIDINGYFAPAGQGGLSLYPSAPCRVLDTRLAGGLFVGTLPVNVVGSVCAPSNTAQAYVLNATVVPAGPLGYLTLWPDGQPQPLVSTLNAIDGAVTSNMAIVPTTNGWIDAFASNPTQLVLDISSYFAP